MDFYEVILSKQVEKRLKNIPLYIAFKLQIWIEGVKNEGLHEVRKRPGLHDGALKGKRLGQRSIRLSKSYRAIYKLDIEGAIHCIKIIEVHKHEY